MIYKVGLFFQWLTQYQDPIKTRGLHYDLVVNGVELGGGSIRIHNADLQRYIFTNVLEMSEQQVEERFGHLIEALSYGAPPHGGIALGLDRLMTLLCNANSLRDVMAFPKSATGNELMTKSPSGAEPKQLEELHISITSK